MGTQYIDWDNSWTTTSIASTSITDTNSSTTAAISLDLKVACLVSVDIDYGSGTTTEGVKVYILSDINATDYEVVGDLPARVYQLPHAASTTYRRTFAIPATDYDDFKVTVENNSGVTVTATVDYKTAVVTTA